MLGAFTAGLRTPDVRYLDDELVAEALDAAADADDLAALEAARECVGVAEGAGLHSAGAVAQLERQVGAPRSGLEPVLAHAREDPLHLVSGSQRAHRAVHRHNPHDVR